MEKVILFMGLPCSGKGTRGEICRQHGYLVFSSSNLLRKAGYDLAHANEIPDQVTIDLVKEEIAKNKNENTKGVILDGFPRTIAQSKILEENFEVQKVFYFKIDKVEELRRMKNRIVCPNCGASYNSSGMGNKPKKPGFCDKCNVPLSRRPRDIENKFMRRCDFFKNETYPVIAFFTRKGLVARIDGTSDPRKIVTMMEKSL